MSDVLNSCPTCGMQMGQCVHEESNVDASGHSGYRRGAFDDLAAMYTAPFDPTHRNEVLSHFPPRPHAADDSHQHAATSTAAAGGVDHALQPLRRALSMLLDGRDDRGFEYQSLSDRISYATASIRQAIQSLESRS